MRNEPKKIINDIVLMSPYDDSLPSRLLQEAFDYRVEGCINLNCKAYENKTHYKTEQKFCMECGEQLSFVCANCWKPMKSDEEKYCTSCKVQKEQDKERGVFKVKAIGVGALTTITTVATIATTVGNNADKIVKGAKKAVDAGVQVAKIIKR